MHSDTDCNVQGHSTGDHTPDAPQPTLAPLNNAETLPSGRKPNVPACRGLRVYAHQLRWYMAYCQGYGRLYASAAHTFKTEDSEELIRNRMD